MLVILFVVAFIIYDSTRSKDVALEKRFQGYEEKELKEYEYEKSPLHTIVVLVLVEHILLNSI